MIARSAHAPVHHLGQHKRLFWAWFVFGAVLYAGRLPTPRHGIGDPAGGTSARLRVRIAAASAVRRTPRCAARVQEQIFALAGLRGALAAPAGAADRHRRVRRGRTIGRATWEVLSRHLNARQLIEFCMLAGQYDALAATISTLQIPLDYPRECA